MRLVLQEPYRSPQADRTVRYPGHLQRLCRRNSPSQSQSQLHSIVMGAIKVDNSANAVEILLIVIFCITMLGKIMMEVYILISHKLCSYCAQLKA